MERQTALGCQSRRTAHRKSRRERLRTKPGEQRKQEDSIYSFYRDIILLRNQNPEIARGTVARLEEIEDSDIAAISKTYEGQAVYLLYNLSETEEKQVELGGYGGLELAGYVSADGGAVTVEDGRVTLPAYSVAVLK